MKYLLKDITIFQGTNSRGDYYWLRATLFNDRNPFMNGDRKVYYDTSNDLCLLYINAGVCTKNAQLSDKNTQAWDVNDESLIKELEPGGKLAKYGDLRHVNATKVTWPLNGVWGRINRQDRVENGELKARKGEFQRTETGQIMEYRELSFYLSIDADDDTGERMYGQDPQQVANRILERGYKKRDEATVTAAQGQSTEQAPAAPQATQATPEELQAQIAALQAQLNG